MPKKIKAWACPGCEALYEQHDDAEMCCPVVGEDGYQCESCGLFFYTEEQAETCEAFDGINRHIRGK